VFLPTPPPAHEAQLLAILFEYRVIAYPRPLPAAARGLTLAGGIALQRDQYLQTQASESLEPGAFGQCPEQTRGEVFIPASHAAEFGVRATAKEWRKHDANDFAQELFLTSQTPFDFGHEVMRKPQGIEGLLEGLSSLLRLAAITCEARLCLQVAPVSGFGMFFGASFGWGHGALLCTVVLP
jgi:hypothetical protein